MSERRLSDEELTDLVILAQTERGKFLAREAIHELRQHRAADSMPGL